MNATLESVKEYLGNTHSWDDAELASALSAETAAQRAVVSYPATDVQLVPSQDFTSLDWRYHSFGGATLTKELGWLRLQATPVDFWRLAGADLQEAAAADVPFQVKVSFTYLRQSTRTLRFSYNHGVELDAPVGVPTAFTGYESVVDYDPESVYIYTTSGSGPVDYAFRDLVVELPGQAPDDLVEALHRRVAHNLALRALPLGIQAAFADSAVATNRVGGTDAEVRRLEAPYRKRIVG